MFEEGTHRDLLMLQFLITICVCRYTTVTVFVVDFLFKRHFKKKKHINVAEMISSICFL